MNMFIQYSIKETDIFDQQLYPRVITEINGLQDRLQKIQSLQKTAIIISLLKEHSLRTDWLDSNTKLAGLLTSGELPTLHLESLFNASKDNQNFTEGLEDYLKTKLA